MRTALSHTLTGNAVSWLKVMLAPEELSITIISHEQYNPSRDSDEVLPPTLVKTSAVLGSLYVSFIARLDLSFYGVTSNFEPLSPFAAFIR